MAVGQARRLPGLSVLADCRLRGRRLIVRGFGGGRRVRMAGTHRGGAVRPLDGVHVFHVGAHTGAGGRPSFWSYFFFDATASNCWCRPFSTRSVTSLATGSSLPVSMDLR